MARRITSQRRTSRLRSIFRCDPTKAGDRHLQIDVVIARMCVLYEDLRLELQAVASDHIPDLDGLDPLTPHSTPSKVGTRRRHYFLRRSICTICEFAEATGHLQGCPETAGITQMLDEDTRLEWDSALSFFSSRRRFIKLIRNDIGGHFGSEAAFYAVEHMPAGEVDSIEVHWKTGKADLRLPFAGTLAGVAFVRHLEGKDIQEKLEWLFTTVLMPAYRHANGIVQTIVAHRLWNRFGR